MSSVRQGSRELGLIRHGAKHREEVNRDKCPQKTKKAAPSLLIAPASLRPSTVILCTGHSSCVAYPQRAVAAPATVTELSHAHISHTSPSSFVGATVANEVAPMSSVANELVRIGDDEA